MNQLRFVDPANTGTVRLDLLVAPFTAGQGINLGGDEPVVKVLQQPPYDGVEIASTWSGGLVTMTIPIVLLPTASAAAIETAMNALNAELRRPTNAIAYRPSDVTSGSAWIFDTVRSPQISLQGGRAEYSQWRRRDGTMFVLNILRQPVARGRGVMI